MASRHPVFSEIIDRARLAAESGKIKGIIWHQGEGDVKEADQYLGKISHLITALRDSLQLPGLPFVAGQLSNDKSNRKALNDTLLNLPKVVPYTGLALSFGTTTFDSTHFDSPSQVLLGERYADQMIQLMEEKRKGKAFPLACCQTYNMLM